MKNVKWIIFFILLMLGTFGLAVLLTGQNIKIKSYDAKVNIDSYGNMEVTETWIIKYPSGYSVRFRDIPYNKNHSNNPLVRSLDYSSDKSSFDEASVSVEVIDLDEDRVLEQGTDYTVGYSFNGDRDERGDKITCDPYSSTCESLFVNLGEEKMKGTKAFTYTYTINGAVTSYDDFSELNWVFFKYTEAKVKSVTIEIHLPSNTFTKDDIYSWGHGTSNGNIKIIDNQNVAIYGRRVKDSDELEVRVAFPSELVSNIDESHKISGLSLNKVKDYEMKLAKESNRQYVAAMIINALTILSVLSTAFMIYYTYVKFDKEYKAMFDKEYLREPPSEIKPADVGFLMNFGKTKDQDVTATLLDLINRKVLTLSDKGYEITSDNPDFDIELNEGVNVNSLEGHEKEVIDFFIGVIGDGKKVNTKDIEKFGKKQSEANKLLSFGNKFQVDVKNQYGKKNYFENARQKATSKHGFYSVCLILLLVLFFIISAFLNIEAMINYIVVGAMLLIYVIYLSTIKKRSKYGNEEFAKWNAFKKFLEEFSHFEDYPMPSIIIWEHYLVYATSLGISDKVMAQLRVKLKELPEEDSSATFMRGYYYRRNNFFIYNTLSHTYTEAKTRSISTIAAAQSGSSGGHGHGGGFSGGSSFGGGGGGGRSR